MSVRQKRPWQSHPRLQYSYARAKTRTRTGATEPVLQPGSRSSTMSLLVASVVYLRTTPMSKLDICMTGLALTFFHSLCDWRCLDAEQEDPQKARTRRIGLCLS